MTDWTAVHVQLLYDSCHPSGPQVGRFQEPDLYESLILETGEEFLFRGSRLCSIRAPATLQKTLLHAREEHLPPWRWGLWSLQISGRACEINNIKINVHIYINKYPEAKSEQEWRPRSDHFQPATPACLTFPG